MPNEHPDSERLASATRQLWAGRFVGVLSTHSLELPGYPFGSLVPYCLDGDGAPLFLLSHLSQHTRNLDADGRCSLNVAEAGNGDVQQLNRVVGVGDIEPLDAEHGSRYLRYYPQSEFYLRELNFRFYRLHVLRFHVNSGFGTARWFGPDRIQRSNPLAPDAEARILEHLLREHPDTPRSCLIRKGLVSRQADEDVRLVGIDADGADLIVRTGQGGHLHRLILPRPINTAEEALLTLTEMADGD